MKNSQRQQMNQLNAILIKVDDSKLEIFFNGDESSKTCAIKTLMEDVLFSIN